MLDEQQVIQVEKTKFENKFGKIETRFVKHVLQKSMKNMMQLICKNIKF